MLVVMKIRMLLLLCYTFLTVLCSALTLTTGTTSGTFERVDIGRTYRITGAGTWAGATVTIQVWNETLGDWASSATLTSTSTAATVIATGPKFRASIAGGSGTESVAVEFLRLPADGGSTSIADGDLTIAKTAGLQDALDAKQDTLVSGTNLKSVNGSSLLGSGDLTVTGSGSDYIVPTDLVNDGRRADTVTVSGTSVTTTGGVSFTGYAGKAIRIEGAGAGGSDYVGTIASVSGSSCTLSVAVSTNVSNATAFWGTDNATAIQAAIESARSTSGMRGVRIPKGSYLTSTITLYSFMEFCGSTEGNVHSSLYSYANIRDNTYGATFLLPMQDAPVISYDDSTGNTTDRGCSGARLHHLAILGSPRQSNIGVKLGDWGVEFSGSISASSTTLTSSTSVFTSAMVGRTVYVAGAGAAGADLETTISSYTSGTQVTLAASAGTTVSGAVAGVGGSNGFFGQLYQMHNVWISGFKYGFTATRVAEMQVFNSQITTCTYGLIFGENPSVYTRHYSDSITLYGNSFIAVGTCYRVDGSKNTVILGGDHNNGSGAAVFNKMLWMRDSVVHIASSNVEGCNSDVIYKIGGHLTIDTITFGQAATGAIVADETGLGTTSIRACTGTVQTYNSLPIAYKTISVANVPTLLPRGMIMMKYSSTAFSTVTGAELTSLLYPNASMNLSCGNLVEEWVKNRTTSPYGSHGWLITTITDGGGTKALALNGTNPSLTTSAATSVVRLGLEGELSWLANYWECRWLVKDGTASWGTSKWHIGVFSGTSSLTPTDGLGFRVDRTASTNIFLELINNGSVTSVDTGLAAASYTNVYEFIVANTPSGKFGMIKAAPSNGGTPIWAGYVSGTLRGVFATPAIQAGSHTGGNVDLIIDRTIFRELSSGSF